MRDTIDAAVAKVRRYNTGGPVPVSLIFVDNANSFYGLSAMPCGFNQDAWTDAMASALGASTYPVVANTLSTSPSEVAAKVRALEGRSVVGAMYEHCFLDRQWTAEEIAQIDTVRTLRRLHKAPGPGFWCYVNGTESRNAAADVIPLRLFQYASFLLTYDPEYSVYQTAYASPPSTFAVLPETQFVPLDPRVAVRNLDSLRTAEGAYVQQFGNCYYRRKLVGACEVAVNPSGAAVEISSNGYRHSMVLSGNGVLDGGSVRFTGAPVDDLAPQSAAILIR